MSEHEPPSNREEWIAKEFIAPVDTLAADLQLPPEARFDLLHAMLDTLPEEVWTRVLENDSLSSVTPMWSDATPPPEK